MARRRRKARPSRSRLRSGAALHRGPVVPAGFQARRRAVAPGRRRRQPAGAIRARHLLQGRPRRAKGHGRSGASCGRRQRSATTRTREVEYAIALYNGDGVTRDEDAAAKIFHKAAQHGSAIAQDRYARIMASGLGAERDPVKAVKWHLISRAAGETDITLDDFMASLPPGDGGGRHQAGAALARSAEAGASRAGAGRGGAAAIAGGAGEAVIPSLRAERSNPASSPSPAGGGSRTAGARSGVRGLAGMLARAIHLPPPASLRSRPPPCRGR